MDFKTGLKKIAGQVYCKRNSGKELDTKDLMVLLADTILDQRFFKSPNWDRLYGGVRYIPHKCQARRPQRILIIQWPAAIGDLAMAAHFLASLREVYPASEISFLADSKASSIYGSSRLVDHFIDNPLDGFLDQIMEGKELDLKGLISTISGLVKTLTSKQFDLAINLQILPSSAVLARLAGAEETLGMTLSQDGIPTIFGNIWCPYLFGVSSGLLRRFNRLHRSEIFRRFLDGTGEPFLHVSSLITDESIRNVQGLFDSKGIKDNDLVIGLNPTANWPTRVWPKFDVLAKALEDKYGAKILIFGSKDDDEAVTRIVKSSNSNAVKVTHLGLNELMAAICGCDLFITNDTGPMHLACLLKRKVVALFGPTSIREVGPWGTESVALQSNKCCDCFKYSCEKEDFCMEHISIEDVMYAAEFLMNRDQGDNKKKTSSDVTWLSQDDEYKFPDDVDEFISRIHLSLLENKYWRGEVKTSVPKDIELPDQEIELIRTMCSNLNSLLRKAIATMNSDNKDALIQDTDRYLIKHQDYIKNIIVLNSMRFLDKSPGITEDIQSYKRYYSGILDDLDYFSRHLDTHHRKDIPLEKVKHKVKKSTNVLIVCNGYPPFYFGGETIYNHHLADALTKKGYNVFIINPIGVSPKSQPSVKFFKPARNISLYQVRIGEGSDFSSKVNAAIMELLEVERINTGIIHCCSTNSCLDAVSRLKERYHVPVLYTINAIHIPVTYDVIVKKKANTVIDDLCDYRSDIARTKQMCENSDLIITTSNAMVSLVMKHYDVNRRKLRMVYNGTDFEKFAYYSRKEEIDLIRKELNITDEKVIIYSGRIEPLKGIQQLAVAVKVILEKYNNIKFIFIGNGSFDKNLKSQLSRYGNVHFIDWMSAEKIAAYYHLADVVVMPSLIEPFGRVVVENMACRTCVIASDADGLDEIVDHDVDGIKLPIRYDEYGDRSIDPEQIIEAIEKTIFDQKKIDFLAANAFEKAKQFDLNHFIDGIDSVYREIMAGSF